MWTDFCFGFFNHWTPNIHIQILPTDPQTFPFNIGWEKNIKGTSLWWSFWSLLGVKENDFFHCTLKQEVHFYNATTFTTT